MSAFVSFGETFERQADGTYKKVLITRVQCANCGVIGWTTIESIEHTLGCPVKRQTIELKDQTSIKE